MIARSAPRRSAGNASARAGLHPVSDSGSVRLRVWLGRRGRRRRTGRGAGCARAAGRGARRAGPATRTRSSAAGPAGHPRAPGSAARMSATREMHRVHVGGVAGGDPGDHVPQPGLVGPGQRHEPAVLRGLHLRRVGGGVGLDDLGLHDGQHPGRALPGDRRRGRGVDQPHRGQGQVPGQGGDLADQPGIRPPGQEHRPHPGQPVPQVQHVRGHRPGRSARAPRGRCPARTGSAPAPAGCPPHPAAPAGPSPAATGSWGPGGGHHAGRWTAGRTSARPATGRRSPPPAGAGPAPPTPRACRSRRGRSRVPWPYHILFDHMFEFKPRSTTRRICRKLGPAQEHFRT